MSDGAMYICYNAPERATGVVEARTRPNQVSARKSARLAEASSNVGPEDRMRSRCSNIDPGVGWSETWIWRSYITIATESSDEYLMGRNATCGMFGSIYASAREPSP